MEQHGLKNIKNVEQQVSPFSWYIEGTTENMLQFIMPLKSIYYKNLGLIEQSCFFNSTEMFKQ
jgi:hypothetical protein